MEYVETDYSCYRTNEDGTEQMANFVAEIAKETRIVDGITTKTMLLVTGRKKKDGEIGEQEDPFEEFPPVEVEAEQFAGMAWVMPAWGVRALIRPGSGIKDDLRAFIQMRSKPERKTIYKHTGWSMDGGEKCFLHAGGAIRAGGNDSSVTVRLPPELAKFDLSDAGDFKVGIRASLELAGLTDPSVTWPLLAATYAPLFGPVDFGVHIAGRTGTYKSEVISLFQCHYGKKMTARTLPGSWSSTANALEAQAYLAANCPFVIDDFVPQGTSWQVRSYQQNADKIIRAQGNQAGRARLTDTSSLQQTMYPRGVILSTGEDIPEGHSVRARLMILELAPGSVKPASLTAAQLEREKFSGGIAGIIRFIAKNANGMNPAEAVRLRAEELRQDYLRIGHSRTPSMLGRLVAVAQCVLEIAEIEKAITPKERAAKSAEAKAAIEEAGKRQHTYLEEADPVDMFVAALKQIFGAGTGHLRSVTGGVPKSAAMVGWIEDHQDGEFPTYRSRGPCIGWISVQKGEIYLDMTSGYNLVKKTAGPELALTKQTMLKRIKEAGKLNRSDDVRQRNTIRITADGHPRQVIALSMSEVLDNEEVKDE